MLLNLSMKAKRGKPIIVERLGTEAELLERLNGQDPYKWAKNYIDELNVLKKVFDTLNWYGIPVFDSCRR